MLKNIASKDLKTQAIVLKRTNYGEADRILNLITPVGKISAMAKGVRKARSKLAGGVEMFTLSDLQIHLGRSEMGVVTSAKMLQYFDKILADYGRMELMGVVLKQVSKAAEHTDSSEWFEITKQVMAELNNATNVALVEAWFWLNLMRVAGEEVNLYRDAAGRKLVADKKYDWGMAEEAFIERERGQYGANEIKVMRLMSTGVELKIIRKIKTEVYLWEKVRDLVRIQAKN